MVAQNSNPNNTSIIISLYESFGKNDIPAILSLMDVNIVWNEAESNSLADGNPYIGQDELLNGVFGCIGEMDVSFLLKGVKLHNMSNNQVLVTLYYVFKKKIAVTYTVQAAHHCTLNDQGENIAFQQYVDTKIPAESE